MTMKKIGFDSQKYIELQSARIRERIDQFGGKLYLEFGGKLFDDQDAFGAERPGGDCHCDQRERH